MGGRVTQCDIANDTALQSQLAAQGRVLKVQRTDDVCATHLDRPRRLRLDRRSKDRVQEFRRNVLVGHFAQVQPPAGFSGDSKRALEIALPWHQFISNHELQPTARVRRDVSRRRSPASTGGGGAPTGGGDGRSPSGARLIRLSSRFGGDSSVREVDLDAGAAEVDHCDQRVGGVEAVCAV